MASAAFAAAAKMVIVLTWPGVAFVDGALRLRQNEGKLRLMTLKGRFGGLSVAVAIRLEFSHDA